METENNLKERIYKTVIWTCFGVAVLFLTIPFIFSPWTPSFAKLYVNPDQLFINGLLATAILSLFLMISVSIALIVNLILKSNRSLSVVQIIGWAFFAPIFTFAISMFTVRTLATFIKIPGGIKINFSDFEPLGFMITASFLSAILALIILIFNKILGTRKYSVLLVVVSLMLVIIGSWRINQNAVAIESQYVLEQCQTLAYGVVRESGLTPIGQELGLVGINPEKIKTEETLAEYGLRCRQMSAEVFALFKQNLLALSLSRKANFESYFETERVNFLKWISTNQAKQ